MAAQVNNDTKSKVLSVVAHVLDTDHSGIDCALSWEDLNVDSLDKVEIIMRLEEAFNIQIDDESFEHVMTVQAAVEYVDGLKS